MQEIYLNNRDTQETDILQTSIHSRNGLYFFQNLKDLIFGH